VLEAAQQAAAAAAGLTEGLAGTFAALLPMLPEQVRLVRRQGRVCYQMLSGGGSASCVVCFWLPHRKPPGSPAWPCRMSACA
jgi:hypothetical protein